MQQFFQNQLPSDAHPYFASIAALRVSAHFLIERDGSLTVLASAGQVIFPQVNQLIHQRGWAVREIEVERGRLDEVFRSLTRGEAA